MKIDPHAPVFPVPNLYRSDPRKGNARLVHEGLTIYQEAFLRAMQGILSNPDLMRGLALAQSGEFAEGPRATVARLAREHADAAIAELNKEVP